MDLPGILTRAVLDIGDLPRRWGSMRLPVRTDGDLLLNSPDGWVADQGRPVWWIGIAPETGQGPIGPTGPWSCLGGGLPAAVERATWMIVGPLTSVMPWRVYRGGWGGEGPPPAETLRRPLGGAAPLRGSGP